MTSEELIKEAGKLVNPKTIDNAEMGGVGCILVTDKNNLFKGVCIDTNSGMGFCAEHTAISQMITQGEYKIQTIVAVAKDKNSNITILAPCGRCREFMYQTNNTNINTDVVLGKNKIVKLKELLPYFNWSQNFINPE